MRDYQFTDGRYISDLTTPEIEDILRVGVKSYDGEDEDAVMERLRLELDIRRIEGRL